MDTWLLNEIFRTVQPRSKPEGSRAGVGSFGGSSQPLPTSFAIWGRVVNSTSGVWGDAPAESEFGAFYLKNLASGDYKLLMLLG